VGLLILLLAGLLAGLAAARYGLLVAVATLAGLAAGAAAFFFPWAGVLAAIVLAVLLPVGVLPLRSGVTPSLLELTLLGCLGGWLLPPLVRADRRWRMTWLDVLVWLLIALVTFSLTLFWDRGGNANVLNNHLKFVLAMATFFAVRQLAREPRRRRQFIAVLLVAAGLAAVVGLVLQALPDSTALDALVRLGPLGYPTAGRVLRYVEDDPAGLERAIGTAVDPNSFGGMLALVAAVALGEALAWGERRWPRLFRTFQGADGGNREEGVAQESLPFPLLVALLGVLLLCLYRTYSRAALGGLAVAALFLVLARYRRLWWGILAILVVAATAVAVLGLDHPVVARYVEGIAFQDLSNQMRLDEYADAWAVVQRYPVLGVGFGNAPDADLVLGVSSIYLTIAERMGLVGLAAFLAAVGAAGVHALRLCRAEPAEAGRRTALLAAVAAALAIGVLDHYFFNPEFSHMAVLFWATLGLASVELDRQA